MDDKEQLIKLQEESNRLLLSIREKHEMLEKTKINQVEFKEFTDKIAQRLDEIDKALTTLRRVPMMADDSEKKMQSEHSRIFEKALRKGYESLTPEERKVMTISDQTTGGYLAPPEFVNEVLKGITDWSPLRQAARVVTTSGPAKQWPKKTQSAKASWVSETGTRAETQNPQLGLETIPVHEAFALAKVSKQDLEDNAFDLRGFLQEEFAEQFGVSEGEAFIIGNGVGKPEGVLVNPNVDASIKTAVTPKIDADSLKKLFYALKSPYAINATWLWNRSTTMEISLLRETTSGNYLWIPGLAESNPPTVLGRPYIECPDMPTLISNAKAVAIGDFRRAYIIVDRIVIEMMDDPYSSKSIGCVEFSARKRVGGQVVLPEAIKILTIL